MANLHCKAISLIRWVRLIEFTVFMSFFFPPLRFSKRTEKPEANFQVVAVLVSKVRVCF